MNNIERAVVGSTVRDITVGRDLIEFKLDTILLRIAYRWDKTEYCINNEYEDLTPMIGQSIRSIQIEDRALAIDTVPTKNRFKIISQDRLTITPITYIEQSFFSSLYGEVIVDAVCNNDSLSLQVGNRTILFSVVSETGGSILCSNVSSLIGERLTTIFVDTYENEYIILNINRLEIELDTTGDWLLVKIQ